MDVHLVDGTYELFRYHFAPNNRGRTRGATVGVVGTMLQLIQDGATHVGVATDHIIESPPASRPGSGWHRTGRSG